MFFTTTGVARALWLAPALVCLLAIAPMPPWYYLALGWLVSCIAMLMAVGEIIGTADGRVPALNILSATAFGAIAITYSPLVNLVDGNRHWTLLNGVVAIVFTGHLLARHKIFRRP